MRTAKTAKKKTRRSAASAAIDYVRGDGQHAAFGARTLDEFISPETDNKLLPAEQKLLDLLSLGLPVDFIDDNEPDGAQLAWAEFDALLSTEDSNVKINEAFSDAIAQKKHPLCPREFRP
jgi:hypothetical protein